jgi:broad specificity phosphatase PhoE
VITPPLLLDAFCAAVRAGRRAALVIRHAARERIIDLHSHREALLVPAGVEAAHAVGTSLRQRVPHGHRLWHSPIRRCRQTAEALALDDTPQQLDVLGTPYILDDDLFGEAFRLHTNTVERGESHNGAGFMRAWFDGRVHEDVMRNAAQAAHEQLMGVLSAMDQPSSIFVTHDLNVALIREQFFGWKNGHDEWPAFLHGFVAVAEKTGATLYAVKAGALISVTADAVPTPSSTPAPASVPPLPHRRTSG